LRGIRGQELGEEQTFKMPHSNDLFLQWRISVLPFRHWSVFGVLSVLMIFRSLSDR
jgi:nitrate/nitrite transporter NarK